MSLIQMSFSGAVMILAVIAVRALALNRLPKKIFVLLWAVILMRLLIPFSIPSVLSAYSFVERNETIQEPLANTPVNYMLPRETEGQINMNAVTTQTSQSNVSGFPIRQVVWIAGMILCAAFFIVSYLRCYFEFRTSLPVRNEFAVKWLEEHPLKRSVQIRQSDQISTPLTYGIFKPVILMPKKTDWENRQQLQYVLLHEYMHIRHFDMVWKLIAAAALCVHWFNPAVWAMYILFNRDIELYCDESVVRQFGDDSKVSYAKALITMEEKRRGLPSLSNNFSKNAIEKRITAIMKTRKRTVWAIIGGAMILVVVIVLFATSAENRTGSQIDSEETADGGMAEGETEVERMEEGRTEGDEAVAEGTVDGERETEQTTIAGITMQGNDVPDVVLDAAKQYVAERFQGGRRDGINADDYSDWRIESLAHVYTYDDLFGMTLQVYRLNYEFLASNPESILLVGGMTIDEEGWVVVDYANCTYFIFQQEREKLTHLFTLFENDCSPGDETFTSDLKLQLGLMEFEEDKASAENYYITEDTATGQTKELVQTMTSFYEAYFSRDKLTLMSHLVENYPWSIEMYEDPEHVDEVEIKGIKGLSGIDEISLTKQYTLSLEFINPGEDSFTYLTVIFEHENDSWKVNFYGLEK